jgi:hypothetical protein
MKHENGSTSCKSVRKEKNNVTNNVSGFGDLAILTALVMTHNSAKASPDMQTITLNTGYNHDNQSAFSIGALDAFWTLTQDPIAGTSEPRSANVINKHAAWQPAQQPPNSQWISYTGNGSTGIKQGPYIYQK